MAIRLRRGNNADFDKNKLVAGELGLVLDAGKLYFCYSAGNTKQLTTADEIQTLLDASPAAYTALQQCLADLADNPSELTNILNNITALQTASIDHTAKLASAVSVNAKQLRNAITNGNFANGIVGWTPTYATAIVSNNVATVTGDGSNTTPYIVAPIGAYAEGKKIYVKLKARVTNSACVNMSRTLVATGMTAVTNYTPATPAQNQWFDMSEIYTLGAGGSGNLTLRIRHTYADTATANGKVMEVKEVVAIDLTSLFGAGLEPTVTEIERMLSFYPYALMYNDKFDTANIVQTDTVNDATKVPSSVVTSALGLEIDAINASLVSTKLWSIAATGLTNTSNTIIKDSVGAALSTGKYIISLITHTSVADCMSEYLVYHTGTAVILTAIHAGSGIHAPILTSDASKNIICNKLSDTTSSNLTYSVTKIT